jgi:meso-butanediol dehydrogenase/(S,S)-butanediol dehydrogenase/diacetyl reductase
MSDFKVSFSLEGQVVVVTGAAQGIGQGVAVAAAGAGADVAVVDLDEGAAAETVSLVEAEGRRALAVGVDVGDRDAVFAAFDRIVAELGRVDGLVNCAAVISENVPVEEATEAAFRDMQPRGSGSIVNIASQAALLSLPNQVVYTATKGAVAAMTRSQAIDWATHGIRVNAIAPTFVWTPMAEPMLQIQQVHDASVRRIPLGRIGQPRDIAGAAVYLMTDASSLITGHVLPVDGGWTAGEPGLDL